MKLKVLAQAEKGIPFYRVKIGEFFTFIAFDDNGQMIDSSKYIYMSDHILRKVDTVGAIQFPYTSKLNDDILYIHDLQIVQVIKKTGKLYKDFIKRKTDL